MGYYLFSRLGETLDVSSDASSLSTLSFMLIEVHFWWVFQSNLQFPLVVSN